ncbi:hypothetical protein HanPI659440_Chr05g0198911 [Helianthus annuus]|nr:hypothetical protein HanPI659440_Chr05g0198911 [Helianthus annuus]
MTKYVNGGQLRQHKQIKPESGVDKVKHGKAKTGEMNCVATGKYDFFSASPPPDLKLLQIHLATPPAVIAGIT